jgi:hypothetical protein
MRPAVRMRVPSRRSIPGTRRKENELGIVDQTDSAMRMARLFDYVEASQEAMFDACDTVARWRAGECPRREAEAAVAAAEERAETALQAMREEVVREK